jgi:hypothetical protein
MGYTPKGSPNFIGDPKAPTASFGDSDTSIANTEFVTTNFVSVGGAQAIYGAKTLTNDLTISDKKISFDSMSSASSIIVDSTIDGETDERFTIDAGGKLSWGPGDDVQDITIERVLANVIQMSSGNILRIPTTPSNAYDVVNKQYVDTISGITYPTKTVTSDYTAVPVTDYTLLVDSTGGPVTITLPLSPTLDTRFEIKDKLGISNSNPIYISPSGIELIDTASTATIASPFQSIAVVYDGFDWFIV